MTCSWAILQSSAQVLEPNDDVETELTSTQNELKRKKTVPVTESCKKIKYSFANPPRNMGAAIEELRALKRRIHRANPSFFPDPEELFDWENPSHFQVSEFRIGDFELLRNFGQNVSWL